MGKLSGFKYHEVIRRLKKFGFEFVRHCSGSHEIWRNVESRKKIALPRHVKDIPEGTLRAVLKEAGIGEDDFLNA